MSDLRLHLALANRLIIFLAKRHDFFIRGRSFSGQNFFPADHGLVHYDPISAPGCFTEALSIQGSCHAHFIIIYAVIVVDGDVVGGDDVVEGHISLLSNATFALTYALLSYLAVNFLARLSQSLTVTTRLFIVIFLNWPHLHLACVVPTMLCLLIKRSISDLDFFVRASVTYLELYTVVSRCESRILIRYSL